MNKLTYIIFFENNEDKIIVTLNSILNQKNQNFNLLFLDNGSTDDSSKIVNEKMQHSKKHYTLKRLDFKQVKPKARNIAIDYVETDYFMFIDAGDAMPSYTTAFYLNNMLHFDVAMSSIHNKSYNIPQFVDRNKVKESIKKDSVENPNLLRKNTSANIVIYKPFLEEFNIRYNEKIGIYSEWAFALDLLDHTDNFIRYYGFPFYYRDEEHDSLDILKYAENNFDDEFKMYINNFMTYFEYAHSPKVTDFMIQDLKMKIEEEFDPHHPQIEERYKNNGQTLSNIAAFLNTSLFNKTKPFFNFEVFSLMKNHPYLANWINSFRYNSRLIKQIMSGHKTKHRSKYELTNKFIKPDPKTIVFESFSGQSYSDSPKAIYEYMYNNYPQYNYKWILKRPRSTRITGPAEKIRRSSKNYYHAYSKAGYWVVNARTPLHLYKKEEQTYIQTWHGTPLKHLGNDIDAVKMPGTNTEKYKRNFRNETKRWDVLLSPNDYSTQIFQSAFWMDKKNILEIGYPKNDILVNHQNNTTYINDIKERLNLPQDKKVILYAPTWRDDEYIKKGQYRFELKIDLQEMYEALGDDYIVLLKMHYLIANVLDIKGFEEFAIDVSNYSNISELFLISDCLITDYSSVMFDYGILKRPQLFFAYDLEKYESELRGFYLDYMTDLPGPIVTESSDLITKLKHLNQVQEDYKEEIEAFNERFCSYEIGVAAKIIGDMIHRDIQNKLN